MTHQQVGHLISHVHHCCHFPAIIAKYASVFTKNSTEEKAQTVSKNGDVSCVIITSSPLNYCDIKHAAS
jgi:hypothetical protein